jgi:hypothetical protein
VQHALLPRGNPKILNPGESITVYRTEPLEVRTLDRGTVAQHVLRALIDAACTALTRNAHISIPGGGGGGGQSGDTGRTPPPPAPPPAP